MKRFLSRLPSPAMVVAVVALLVALGGTSVAAVVITTASIKNGTIRNRDIHKRTISRTRLKNNTLTGRQIREGTLRNLRCPGGTARFGAGCVDLVARAPAQWGAAAQDCGPRGLVDAATLFAFLQGRGLTGSEWAADPYDETRAFTVNMANGALLRRNINATAAYRCIRPIGG